MALADIACSGQSAQAGGFDQSVAWLWRHRVLPGATVLARLVASERQQADGRLPATVIRQAVRADPGLPGALSGLLVVSSRSQTAGGSGRRRS